MKTFIIALILCGSILCIAGCTTNSEAPSRTTQPITVTTPTTTLAPPPVNITVVNLTRYYRPDGGCVFGAQVDITNTGHTSLTGTAIRFSLRETKSGSVRDVYNLFLERIDPGDPKTFTVNFDGDCAAAYGIRADIS